MSRDLLVDPDTLHEQVRDKFREVALEPNRGFCRPSFTDITIGPAADTFAGATGEGNAKAFEVYGYAFLARNRTRRGSALCLGGSESASVDPDRIP